MVGCASRLGRLVCCQALLATLHRNTGFWSGPMVTVWVLLGVGVIGLLFHRFVLGMLLCAQSVSLLCGLQCDWCLCGRLGGVRT